MSNSLISTRTNGNIYMYVPRNINITKYWKINVQNICYLCNNSVCKERYFLLSWFCDMKMFWHVMVGIWLQKLFRRRKQVWKYFWWSDLFLTQWIFCEKREIWLTTNAIKEWWLITFFVQFCTQLSFSCSLLVIQTTC